MLTIESMDQCVAYWAGTKVPPSHGRVRGAAGVRRGQMPPLGHSGCEGAFPPTKGCQTVAKPLPYLTHYQYQTLHHPTHVKGRRDLFYFSIQLHMIIGIRLICIYVLCWGPFQSGCKELLTMYEKMTFLIIIWKMTH